MNGDCRHGRSKTRLAAPSRQSRQHTPFHNAAWGREPNKMKAS